MASMAKRSRAFGTFLYILLIVLMIILDQITKRAAVSSLRGSDPYIIIENVLELLYVENRGAAFGMMNGMRGFFLFLAPAVSAVLLYCIHIIPRVKRFLPLTLSLCGIVAGAAGNFIDRLINAYVVDFIYFMPIDFPVFNVADIYVTCSTTALVLLIAFYYSDNDLNDITVQGQLFGLFKK